MNKDDLKKHHFWILFAPVLLFVLIAVLSLWNGIGGKIEAREKEIDGASTAAKGKTSIKPKMELTLLEEENNRVGLIRYDKWRDNWVLQVGVEEWANADTREMRQVYPNLFRWPNSPKLSSFNYAPDGYTDDAKVVDRRPKFKGLKFGADIPNENSQLSEFQKSEIYLAEYSTLTPNDKPGTPGRGMADHMYPTQFLGGWATVLRHVYAADAAAGYGWGQGKPNPNAVWLALEDLWVQRSLLESLRGVNDRMAAFAPVGGTGNRKTFTNRTWQLEVWTIDRAADNKRVLVGKLTNITPRLQTFGLNGKLTFKVSIKNSGEPVDLVFSERYLTGKGGTKRKQVGAGEEDVPGDSLEILPEKGTVLNQTGPLEIEGVRQEFDTRTVPIQRIDRLVLGYPDSRLADRKPMQPMFIPAEESSSTDPTSLGTNPMSSSSPIGTPDGRPGGPGGLGGASAGGWSVVTGPVTSKVLLDSTKLRYLQANQQVRRMPVGMVLVVDQANLQDVLMALANSPLRFQITQVHWQRFRGTLGGGDTGSSGPSEYRPGSSSSLIGSQGSSDTASTGPGIMVGPRRPGGVGAIPGPGPTPAPGPRPGTGPGPGSGPLGGEDLGDGDVQMTSGLIEVSIYGIISLYEKYEPSQATPTNTP